MEAERRRSPTDLRSTKLLNIVVRDKVEGEDQHPKLASDLCSVVQSHSHEHTHKHICMLLGKHRLRRHGGRGFKINLSTIPLNLPHNNTTSLFLHPLRCKKWGQELCLLFCLSLISVAKIKWLELGPSKRKEADLAHGDGGSRTWPSMC